MATPTITTSASTLSTAEPSTPYPPCVFRTAEEKQLYRRLKTIYERHSATWDQDARDAWPSVVERASLKASTVKKVTSHTLARTLTDENLTWAHVVVLRVIFKSMLFTSQKVLKIIRRKYPSANFNTFSYREEYKLDKPDKPDRPGKVGGIAALDVPAELADDDMEEKEDDDDDDALIKELMAAKETFLAPTPAPPGSKAKRAAKSRKTSANDSAEIEMPVEGQQQDLARQGVQGKDQDERGHGRVADPAGSSAVPKPGRRTRASVRRGAMSAAKQELMDDIVAAIKGTKTRLQRGKAKKKAQSTRAATPSATAQMDGPNHDAPEEQGPTGQDVGDGAPPKATRDAAEQQGPIGRASLAPATASAPPQLQVGEEHGRNDVEIKQEAAQGSPSPGPLLANRPSTPEHKPVIIPNETYAWASDPQHHAASISPGDDHHPPLHAPLRHFAEREQPGPSRHRRYAFNAAPAPAAAPPAYPPLSNAAGASDSLSIPLSEFLPAKAQEAEAFCGAYLRAEEEKQRRLAGAATQRERHEVALTSQTMRLDETLKRMARKLADQDRTLARITSTLANERALSSALQERVESLERAVRRL